MGKGLCVVVSGGEYCPLPEELRGADYVIACDRGWQYAQRMGLRPDWIVGDFDSAPPPETDVSVTRVPTRKDDTDTMLAARQALALGYRDVAILCAFGGRLTRRLPRREQRSLSLFALSERCEGVSIRGTKYECENETLTNSFPLGVSNVWASPEAEISVRSGILLVLQSALTPGEHI